MSDFRQNDELYLLRKHNMVHKILHETKKKEDKYPQAKQANARIGKGMQTDNEDSEAEQQPVVNIKNCEPNYKQKSNLNNDCIRPTTPSHTIAHVFDGLLVLVRFLTSITAWRDLGAGGRSLVKGLPGQT